MATVKATIFFDKRFWVGTFERTDKEGYAVARHIFGSEPSDPEVHEFVLSHYHELKFGEAKEITIQNSTDESKKGAERSAPRNGKNERNIKAINFSARLHARRN